MAGKGSGRRPRIVTREEYERNADNLDWNNDKAKPLTEEQIEAAIRTITGEK